MHFVFYPRHEYGCPHVRHCPHLGGAALGSLVLAADEQTEWTDALLRQIDALRAEATAKYHKIEELTAQVEQLQRELKAERQKQFQRKRERTVEEEPESTKSQGPQKRGAPVGNALGHLLRAGIADGRSSLMRRRSCPRPADARIAMVP